MNSQDDYELLPHQEVEHLRKEVEKLKSSPSGQSKLDQKLISSIESLTTSIHRLESVFDSVRKDILKDYETTERPEDLLKQLIKQNKSIAEVLITLVDKVNNLEQKHQVNDPIVNVEEKKPEPQQEETFRLDKEKLNKEFENLNEPKKDNSFNKLNIDDIPKPQKHENKGFLGMFKK
jgi:flagellar hook-associated protein FlgK